MLPGSLHYRYQAKEDILVDLMRLGLEEASIAVSQSVAGVTEPAEQLRRGINAHLQMLVSGSDMVYVLLFEWRSLRGGARREMIKLRDRYESLWAAMLQLLDRKSTRLNSSHVRISYAVFCLKKKKKKKKITYLKQKNIRSF